MEDLTTMCRREYPRLVGVLGLYTGDPAVAEELAQETLIRLCRDWRRVRRLRAPDQWLQRVAINLAHSHYRRKSLERTKLSLLAAGSRRADLPPTDIETLDLLKGLPHRQKAALILHYYLDFSVREAADVLEIPEGTVKTLVHRAIKALNENLEIGTVPNGI